MNLKNKKLIYFALATTSISLISYSLFAISTIFKNPETKKQNSELDLEKDFDGEEYKYLVKEVNGKINIFESGKAEPIDTLEKEVEYLPVYDQKMLKDGIYLDNLEQLNKVLEDYDD